MNNKGALYLVSWCQLLSRTITYTQDALGADQLDELVLHRADGVALSVGLEVTKVTDVADFILGGTVGLAEGVEVGASRGAAVGVVSELVDVEGTVSVGIVAADVPGDVGGGALVGLFEGDGAGDLGVTTEDGNFLKVSKVSPINEQAKPLR